MRITWPQPEAVLEQDSRIHASEDGRMTARADIQVSKIKTAGEHGICGKKIVGYGQSFFSVLCRWPSVVS
jgi:hypothetical protein